MQFIKEEIYDENDIEIGIWGEYFWEVGVDDDASPSTASVLLVNILLCLSVGDMVCMEELECEEVPETKVFSLSASEVIFFLVWLGVGGLDTEYTKSSLSSSCTEHESLLSEYAAESVVASEWSVLKYHTEKCMLSGKFILRILWCAVDQLWHDKSKDSPIRFMLEWIALICEVLETSLYCLSVSNDRLLSTKMKASYESNKLLSSNWNNNFVKHWLLLITLY